MWRTDRLGTAPSRAVGAVTGTPAFNLAIFELLLNFAWEILQAPCTPAWPTCLHAKVTRVCLQATVKTPSPGNDGFVT